MPYPTTVDVGTPPPWYLGSDAAELSAGGTTGVMTANQVYLIAVSTPVQCAVTGMRTHVGSTATGTTDMGVYDSNGNLLAHTGAVSNSASTTMTNSLSSSYTLAPGNYFLAFCPSNSTDTYSKIGALNTPGAISAFRVATNTGTAGVLPNTLSTILAPTSGGAPVFSGVVSGGLP